MIGTITSLLIGLSAPKILVIPVIISLILLPLFVLNEIYLAKDPIIPVIVLKSRGVLLSCLGTIGFMMCRWSVLFYTPVYSIAVRGWSPAAAGTILIPTNGGFAVGGLLVGWVHIRRAGSFYTYTDFPLTFRQYAPLTIFQSLCHYVHMLPHNAIDLIPCIDPNHPPGHLLSRHLCQWLYRRRCTQLHLSTRAAPHPTGDSFHCQLSDCDFPRLCRFLRVCRRWRCLWANFTCYSGGGFREERPYWRRGIGPTADGKSSFGQST